MFDPPQVPKALVVEPEPSFQRIAQKDQVWSDGWGVARTRRSKAKHPLTRRSAQEGKSVSTHEWAVGVGGFIYSAPDRTSRYKCTKLDQPDLGPGAKEG
ncbi:hypothetical protein RJZ57_005677 [Blastomyces gilchristii]